MLTLWWLVPVTPESLCKLCCNPAAWTVTEANMLLFWACTSAPCIPGVTCTAPQASLACSVPLGSCSLGTRRRSPSWTRLKCRAEQLELVRVLCHQGKPHCTVTFDDGSKARMHWAAGMAEQVCTRQAVLPTSMLRP